ncbi:MAG: hypothetical protein ACREGC_02520, partial [Minisyncoccia bacterium]
SPLARAVTSGPYVNFSLIYTKTATTPLVPNGGGTLSFSPSSVTNGQSFQINLTGGPANTQTDIWVDNGTGSGFQDFGSWVTTDANGSISTSRNLNCAAYVTYVPGKSSDISGMTLTQKVYLAYAGSNAHSSTATHTKDCSTKTASGGTPPPPPPPPPPSNTACPIVPCPANYSGNGHYTPPPVPAAGTYTATKAGGAPITVSYNFGSVLPPTPGISGSVAPGARAPQGLTMPSNISGNHIYAYAVNIPWQVRYDISDPFNPKNSAVIPIVHGGWGGAGGDNGPFLNTGGGDGPASAFFQTFGEAPDGTARGFFNLSAAPVASNANPSGSVNGNPINQGGTFTSFSGTSASLGQQVSWGGGANFSPGTWNGFGAGVLDYTSTGRFLLIGNGPSWSSSPNPKVYDATTLSGSINSPYINSIASLSWPNARQFGL